MKEYLFDIDMIGTAEILIQAENAEEAEKLMEEWLQVNCYTTAEGGLHFDSESPAVQSHDWTVDAVRQ